MLPRRAGLLPLLSFPDIAKQYSHVPHVFNASLHAIRHHYQVGDVPNRLFMVDIDGYQDGIMGRSDLV